MVEKNKFRPDLFERLNVLEILVPTLKERPEDIPYLVQHFCEQFNKETKQNKKFLHKTIKYLQSYDWPRNVRELKNVVERVLYHCQSDTVTPQDLEAKFYKDPDFSLSLIHI